MANDDIDIKELLTPKFEEEMIVQGSRRVVCELLESVMRQHSWDFQKVGGNRDLEVVFQIGKQLRELSQDNRLRINGWICLLSIAGQKTLVRFYSSPRTLAELTMMSISDYEIDMDFVRQVADAIKERFTELGIIKTPK